MAFRPTQPPNPTTAASGAAVKSPFFQQRDALVNEIALELESVLQSINKLNRSLEGVIAVGNEFGAVEALWSQFEGVMATEEVEEEREGVEGGKDGQGRDEEGEGEEDEAGDRDGEEKGRRR